MRVLFDGHRFIAQCNFDERFFPKKAGFYWDFDLKKWVTTHPGKAAMLRDYCDESALKELNRLTVIESPWLGRLSHPKHLTPRPFQIEAAIHALTRNHSYLALDPGLGKTIIAALISRALHEFETVYICPPFLVLNTLEEFEKWGAFAHVFPDSMLKKSKTLDRLQMVLMSPKPKLLIVDEAHRFKTHNAQRTEALFKSFVPHFERQVYMSGTPMPNRPMELFPVLSNAAAETIGFRNRFEFGLYFCAGFKHETYGWDFNGASNLKELITNAKKSFMLRMKKDDVLRDLPPKTEQLVFIGDKLPANIQALEKEILKSHDPQSLVGENTPIGELATYRKEIGLAKLLESTEFIKSILEETNESILIFAHHRDVIAGLADSLEKFHPLIITGETPMAKRHDIVKVFQQGSRRVFIGNIQAAGTGLTLTRASRVIFAEFSWVPADNDQASDRAHRIGQRDHVFVQYLVFKNSIDRQVMETILRKKKIINQL